MSNRLLDRRFSAGRDAGGGEDGCSMFLPFQISSVSIFQLLPNHPVRRMSAETSIPNVAMRGLTPETIENEAGAVLTPAKRRRPQYYDSNDQWNPDEK